MKCNKYKEIFGPPNGFENDLDLIPITIKSHILDLISRAIHVYGEENELDESQFLKIYNPLENRVMNQELYFDIYVPILFTKFEIEEEYIISDTISIVKMEDVFQKSRSEIISYSESIPDSVLMSATHALKLQNYFFENKNTWLCYSMFDDLNSYPLDEINAFFNALRINNDILVGYAQIIGRPLKWVEKYKANLMYLKGVATRSYPTEFNNYYWNRDEFPTINKKSLDSIKNLFQIIKEEGNKKISLACARLENSFYRNNEGDKVIDLVIGLESLLSDNEKGEITYKLSLRAAYLLQLSSLGESKSSIFNNMKAIYSCRSAIVHGQKNIEKKRFVKDSQGNQKLVLDVAYTYLKECVKVLASYPQFLDATEIDKKIILN
jgi:Apea-like HEPN